MGLLYKCSLYCCATLVTFSAMFYYNHFCKEKQSRKEATIKLVRLSRHNSKCITHFHQNSVSHKGCSVEQKIFLIQFLQSARKKISICVYNITISAIIDEIISMYKKGLNVRLISDISMCDDASKVKELQEAGVPVILLGGESSMHNKFMIIDDVKCVFGSMNWSKNSFCSNEENIIVTDAKQIIEQLVEYFELEWKTYSSLSNVSTLQNSNFLPSLES